MVRCEKCDTPNSLDSRFCKSCGTVLTDNARTEGAEKLQELIGEGYRLLGSDRAEEALLVAESALATDPKCSQALSLKGACLERLGRLVEALEAFEKVVEIVPDSQIDRVKVNYLRQELAKRADPEPVPNRKLALGLAISVTVLVMIGGAIVSVLANQKSEEPIAQENLLASNSNETVGFNLSGQGSGNPTNPNQQGGSADTQSQQDGGANPNPSTGNNGGRQLPDFGDGTALPRPLPDGVIGQVPPVTPPGADPGLELRPETPPNNDPRANTDPPPKVDEDQRTPPPDPGRIDIKVYSGSQTNLGGGESVSNTNKLTALLRTARDQFQLGQFAAAARTYQAALDAGGDPGTLNQRIGQCHANSGQKAEAALAYTRAIAAFQSQIDKGLGDDSTRRGLETCRQALKILQGR